MPAISHACELPSSVLWMLKMFSLLYPLPTIRSSSPSCSFLCTVDFSVWSVGVVHPCYSKWAPQTTASGPARKAGGLRPSPDCEVHSQVEGSHLELQMALGTQSRHGREGRQQWLPWTQDSQRLQRGSKTKVIWDQMLINWPGQLFTPHSSAFNCCCFFPFCFFSAS